jgi:hypothetical protein
MASPVGPDPIVAMERFLAFSVGSVRGATADPPRFAIRPIGYV